MASAKPVLKTPSSSRSKFWTKLEASENSVEMSFGLNLKISPP